MLMSEEKKRRFCKDCNAKVLAVRKGTNHLLHFFISLFTIGLWVPIWIFSAIKIGGWKCPTCGRRC